MKRISLVIIYMMFLPLLSACGGTDGTNYSNGLNNANNSAAVIEEAEGIFINGPIVGLGYSSGGISGVTGAKGEYEYQPGTPLRFYLGDIVIGETMGESLITLLHLVPGADAENIKVINIARFLLSVGQLDPATNVLTIPESVFNAAKGKTIDFETITETDLQDMVRFLKNDPDALLISIQEAINAVTAGILRIYGGTYQGIFSGPASSTTWELSINPDGTVSGKGLDGLQESIEGSITKGIIFNGKADGGCLITGYIDIYKKEFTGSWFFNFDPSKNGTFIGQKNLNPN